MSFVAKDYQRRTLTAWRDFTERVAAGASAEAAFAAVTTGTWGRPLAYVPSPCLAQVPVACIRIPTGGGKTFVAAAACGIAAASGLIGDGRGSLVVVWLVPSTAIADQTLRSLRDPRHPCRQALVSGVDGHPGLGPVRVVDLDGALALPAADYRAGAVVVVATIQNFRIDDTEQREVYRQNGHLMSHDPVDPRLSTVFARHHPLVVVDEAHSARSDKSFDALGRLSPGLVLEITATPVREGGVRLPSNQLISVSAAELHAEEMVKLPLELAVNADPGHCLGLAVRRRDELQRLAEAETAVGGTYLRPLLLVQAQAKKAGAETLVPDEVRRRLIADHGVPERAIRIATGSVRELDDLDGEYPLGLFDPTCPVTVIITVEALREGWDCPWAYVLCTLRSSFTETGAAQILGRILRQPGARRRATEALNRSYAVAAAPSFPAALAGLRDALVDSLGYERESAAELAVPATPREELIELTIPAVVLPAGNALIAARVAALPASLANRVAVDAASGRLEVTGWLDEAERRQVVGCIADPPQAVAFNAALRSALERGAAERAGTPVLVPACPAERGILLRVPQLMVHHGRQWTLFGDSQLGNREWRLSDESALLDERGYQPRDPRFDQGEIDVTTAGRIVSRVRDGEDAPVLVVPDEHPSDRLVWWLESGLGAQDVHIEDLHRWVQMAVRHLTANRGIELARLEADQWHLLLALRHRLEQARLEAQRQGVQELLFDAEARQELKPTRTDLHFLFDPAGAYPASELEREVRFAKHYYRTVGAFDSAEERACAVAIDALPQIIAWVRNLVGRERHSFRLPRRPGPNGRWFYPDFVALLGDGRILVVEYKGADRVDSQDTRDKREAGELWERITGGLFLIVEDRDYDAIRRKLAARPAPAGDHPSWPAGYRQEVERIAGEADLGDIEPFGFAAADLDPRELEDDR